MCTTLSHIIVYCTNNVPLPPKHLKMWLNFPSLYDVEHVFDYVYQMLRKKVRAYDRHLPIAQIILISSASCGFM